MATIVGHLIPRKGIRPTTAWALSPYVPGPEGILGLIPSSTVEHSFTAPEECSNSSHAYVLMFVHTQCRGTGLRGDPIFDRFYVIQVRLQLDPDISNRLVKQAPNAPVNKVSTSEQIVHSPARPYGCIDGDRRPELRKGLQIIELEDPPSVQPPGRPGEACIDGTSRLPLLYNPPVEDVARDLETVQVPPPMHKEELYILCMLQADPPWELMNLAKEPVTLARGRRATMRRMTGV